MPIWIAIEVWDFGLLSYFLEGLKDRDKKKIAGQYGLARHGLLISWVRAINFARNTCAHHSRFWNISPPIKPKLPQVGEVKELEHLLGDKDAQTRIYVHAATIQYLLKRINPGSSWNERLYALLVDLPDAPGISLKNMGFPKDWEKLDLWK